MLPAGLLAAPPKPTAPVKAGNISALLPTAHVLRGAGKAQVSTDAKKGDELVWNDVVKTDKGGRARITLLDQSTLSVGSQAELKVVQHDPKAQQTSLELTYGRVRAEVTKITGSGSFTVRTPTAVAGVIGTDFGTTSGVGFSEYVCLSGVVSITSNSGGNVHCGPGEYVRVDQGKPPSQPKPATPQQLLSVIQDTEPAVVTAISPSILTQGASLEAVVTGPRLAGTNAVNVSGTGLQATMTGAPTPGSVNLHLQVDPAAAPGLRTITLSGTAATPAVAVVTVLAPASAGSDAKQTYHDALEASRVAANGSLNGMNVGLQQAENLALAQLMNANAPITDVNSIRTKMDALVKNVGDATTTATQANDKTEGDAVASFDTAYAAALDSLQKRRSDATPDAVFNDAVTQAYNNTSKTMLGSFTTVQENLGRLLQEVSDEIAALSQSELDKVASMPAGGMFTGEATGQVGVPVTIAAKGAASNAPSLEWTLCAGTKGPCNPIPGATASGPDFVVDTCSVEPGNYRATLNATDLTGTAILQQYLVHILPDPSPAPIEQLSNMAGAYIGLQPEQFMRYFDPVNFGGYGLLSENIRKTFAQLTSMSINLRPSLNDVRCNEATVRADWQQNYTFRSNPQIVYHQSEQLTVRFVRTPNKGWLITEFQGDNGTVQGTPPGPTTASSDTAQADVDVAEIVLANSLRAPFVSGVQRAGAIGAAASGPAIPLSPGPQNFSVALVNRGTVALKQSIDVRFQLVDFSQHPLTFTDVTIEPPFNPGQTQPVTAVLNVPRAPNTPVQLQIIINPGCVVPLKVCGGVTTSTLNLVLGTIDLAVVSLTAPSPLIGTAAGVLNAVVQNVGDITTPAASLTLTSTDLVGLKATATIPSLAAGASATVPVNFTVPSVPGTAHTFVAQIVPPVSFDKDSANDKTSVVLPISLPFVDLRMKSLAFAGGNPPFASGQSRSVSFQLQNAGNVSSAAATVACVLTAPSGTKSLGTTSVPSVAPGATSATATVSFTVPSNSAGADTLTCTAATDPLEAPTATADNAQSLATQVNSSADLQITGVSFGQIVSGVPTLQMGAAGQFGGITVRNAGLDDAPAGADVLVKLNGASVATGTVPLVPAGSSVTVAAAGNVPVTGNPPQDLSQAFEVDVNANGAVVETNLSNNAFTGNARLVDFAINAVKGPQTLVSGRAFNFIGATTDPTNYPLAPIAYAANGLTGATANVGSTGAVALIGTAAPAAGAATPTVTGTVAGVTHASGPIDVQILSEITMSEPSAPTLTSGGSAQPLTLNVTGGVYPVAVTIALTGGLTTTSSQTQTIAAAGSLSWDLQAPANTAGGSYAVTFHATDAGVPATNTPAGVKDFTGSAVVQSLPDFAVTSASIAGHGPAPFSGSNSVQLGETSPVSFTIVNQGGSAPAGTLITITIRFCPAVGPGAVGVCSQLSTDVPAPAAGQSLTQNTGLPNSDSYGSASVALSLTTRAQQVTTSNDSLFVPIEVVDFALQPTQKVATVINNRAFNFQAVSVSTPNQSPYPLPITYSYSANVTQAGVTSRTGTNSGVQFAGTGGQPGTYSITVTGAANGVSRNTTVVMVVGSDFTITERNPPTITQPGGIGVFSVDVGGDANTPFPANVTLTLPSSISITGPSTQTITGPQTVSWLYQASPATGNYPAVVNATGPGIAATNTANGNVTLNTTFFVQPPPNYAPVGLSFANHSTPYTGANGLNVEEQTSVAVEVRNSGGTAPPGTTLDVTLLAGCTDCSPSPLAVVRIPAPAAGQDAVANFTYTIPGGDVSYPYQLLFDASVVQTGQQNATTLAQRVLTEITDFQLFASPVSAVQNIRVGGATPPGGTVDFTLFSSSTGTFLVPLNLTIPPGLGASLSAGTPFLSSPTGNTQTLTLQVTGAPTPGPATVSIAGTHYGVVRKSDIPVQLFTAQITNQTYPGNGSSNPQAVPIGSGVNAQFQVVGNWDTTSSGSLGQCQVGEAVLVLPTITGYTVNANSPCVALNGGVGNFTVGIQAVTGASTSVPQPITITLQIPGTKPLDTVSSTMFVLAQPPTDLSVTSVAPNDSARDFQQHPLLYGETAVFNVTVHNGGNSASTGGSTIRLTALGLAAGTISFPVSIASIPAGQDLVVPVTAVIPDLRAGFSQSTSIVATLSPDAGETNTSNNSGATTVPIRVCDWIPFIPSGQTGGSSAPLALSSTGTTGTVNVEVGALADGPLTFFLDPSQRFTFSTTTAAQTAGFAVTSVSPTSATGAFFQTSSIAVNVSATPGTAQQGPAYVQVLAQLGSVTRQVTVYLTYNSAQAAGVISVTSNLGNANSISSPTPAPAVQLNGILPSTAQLTVNCVLFGFFANAPPPCASTGSTQLSFSDPQGLVGNPHQTAVIPLSSPTTNFTVVAAQNPDGSLLAYGPNVVTVSAEAIKTAGSGTSPDPVNPVAQLQYNVGELVIFSSSCFAIGVGGSNTANFDFQFQRAQGFNLPDSQISWGVTPLPAGLSASATSGSGVSATLSLTNTNAVAVPTLQSFTLYAVVSSNGTTAYVAYPISVDMSAAPAGTPGLCGGGTAQGARAGFWSLTPPGSSARNGGPQVSKIHAAGKLPELSVVPSSTVFSPSVPKPGDNVDVRFRIANNGDADAMHVPVELQVNGIAVAQDTFDVPAGRTILAGMQWQNAQPVQTPTAGAARMMNSGIATRGARGANGDGASSTVATSRRSPNSGVQIVIDPQHTIAQKTAGVHGASVSHLDIANPEASVGTVGGAAQRAMLEVSDTGCAGLRFTSGAAGNCDLADVSFTVEDLGNGRYSVAAENGVADLGMAVHGQQPTAAGFTPKIAAVAGHTYAVQLRNGSVAQLTIRSIRNPQQLNAKGQRVFHGGKAANTIQRIGGGTGAPTTGDTAGTGTHETPMVYFDVTYSGQ